MVLRPASVYNTEDTLTSKSTSTSTQHTPTQHLAQCQTQDKMQDSTQDQALEAQDDNTASETKGKWKEYLAELAVPTSECLHENAVALFRNGLAIPSQGVIFPQEFCLNSLVSEHIVLSLILQHSYSYSSSIRIILHQFVFLFFTFSLSFSPCVVFLVLSCLVFSHRILSYLISLRSAPR